MRKVSKPKKIKLPKQPKKSTLINKLDDLVGKIVRSNGRCERIGLGCKQDSHFLQCCHINSRKYNLTRWDLDNLLCLCATCHAHFHDHPLELGDFVKKVKGEIIWENLQEVYKSTKKYTTDDLQIKLKILTELLEGR